MRRSSPLCCDANIVVRFVADEKDVIVRELVGGWRREQRRLVAPPLFRFEVTNALYRLWRGKVLSERAAREALEAALRMPIGLLSDDRTHLRATELSARFNRPTAYDAHYLALAESLNAEFWTTDQRL